MPDTFRGRLKHAWTAFRNPEYVQDYTQDYGPSSHTRPDRQRMMFGNERSIVSGVYTRIGIDVAAVDIQHMRMDQNGRFTEAIDSHLNECLRIQANIDQSGRALIQDAAMSLLDEGSIAIVPVDTTLDPTVSGSFDIQSLRIGQVIGWHPKHVRVKVYNDATGRQEEVILPKSMVAIVENPLYSVMNEPNSTLKRLVQKLNLLDAVDNQSGSGKLDLIIQLPYAIKSETQLKRADERKKAIEMQLTGSKYGIAYIDGTEKVTQLNRPAENNLMTQIEYLTSMLYSQLGITENVFNGTADETEMLNYYNRTIEPILSAITEAMNRTFLTKTARTQGQRIHYIRAPFKLVPVNGLAEIVDKFSRNEILSSNEIRSIIGYKPVADPEAEELRNANLNKAKDTKTPDAEDVVNKEDIVDNPEGEEQ